MVLSSGPHSDLIAKPITTVQTCLSIIELTVSGAHSDLITRYGYNMHFPVGHVRVGKVRVGKVRLPLHSFAAGICQNNI
jgi:hypothetical protein